MDGIAVPGDHQGSPDALEPDAGRPELAGEVVTVRRRIGLGASLLLLPVALGAGLTGLAADLLDLNDFVLHAWAGYAAAVLAIVHVVAHWPDLVAGSRTVLAPRRRAPAGDRRAAADAPPPVVAGPMLPAPAGPVGAAGLLSRRSLLVAGAAGAGLATGWVARGLGVGAPPPGGDLGQAYHRASGPGVEDLLGAVVDWGARPADEPRYPGSPRIPLPTAELPVGGVGAAVRVDDALRARRSRRSWAERDLTLDELGWILWATAGLSGAGLRTAPSAGAAQALEQYVVVKRVEGLEPGVYWYEPRTHDLVAVRPGRFDGDLLLAALGQGFVASAPATVAVAAVFQRLRWRYRERAYRYALLEAGHAGQNLYLAAEAAGLATCAVGAFLDGSANGLLGLDGEAEAVLCLYPVAPRAD